ncbi:carboxypeptidase-like regulatory domain-containing protein [Bacteroides faecis]|uniref:carboxypeptidase-like regulatory domain-containing protein n=1 Tax=Bacteroides faecis TaxID=674529 RepID=UPI00286E7625|nr:carboxypeptidase-like regulatory domain-containing protein [Bacteroides faecis]MCS2233003.1 carboxypeptidase-like regulatory domain-containing protein [Bacteroides faecis]
MLLLACLFVGISLVTAQTQKVTGVVISEEDGQPVVGASVLVKGTTQGTITDIDGNFNLANYQVLQRLCRFRISVCRHKKWLSDQL